MLAELLVSLFAPEAGAGTYNDWRLVATSSLAPLLLAAAAGALVLSLLASWRGLVRVELGRRLLLLFLRVLAAAWVFALLLKPALELRAVSKVRTRVPLLVDVSRSMSLAAEGGTRAELVEKHLGDSAGRLAELADRAVVEPATFGERLHVTERLPSPLPTDDRRSDLARALSEVEWQSSGREISALILYSDGSDTEGLSVEAARALGARLGAPIYAVGFSRDSSAPDVAIRRVLADDFAFVHNTVTMDVDVEARGLSLSSLTVSLKQDGAVVAVKEAALEDGRGRVTFDFKPRRIGKLVYEVSVPVQSGEVVDGNNQKSVVLKVIRDRIRVLQVAGRPSWDERFLREFLKRNPNVDLISFFILRSTTDLQKATPEEMALIPFPVSELFTTELATFDVVIYQNFSYRPYQMVQFLPHVRDYVLKGGAFLMIGGDQSFADGGYDSTPIAEILPTVLDGAAPYDAGEFRPRLTKEGRRHPITRVGEPGEVPDNVFARLPALTGLNSATALAPGAQALLVHPSLPGNPPVVAVREVGQGRTMALATDTLWFWRYLAVGEGSAGREFDRFWTSTLRWLIKDPELARVRVQAQRSVVLLGEPVLGEVRALGPDYRGLVGARVTAELVPVGGGRRVGEQVEAVTGAEGVAVVAFPEVPAGTYLLRARADAADGLERIGAGEDPVIVESTDVELQAPIPRPELLAALAEGSGGAYVDIREALPAVRILDPRRVEVDRTKQIPIWDGFPALLGLLALVGVEWWLRRRSGLL